MVYSLVLLCVLVSGSFFASTFFNKEFERVLPVTCMGIAVLLYFFGLLNALKFGFYAVLFLSFLLYIASITYLIYKKDILNFRSHFITPAFFIFLLFFFVLSFCNSGKLAYEWDEFSHWIDSVKVMWSTDDFITNPTSHSAFQSYPPIMSLFQYFCQKLIGFLNLGTAFVEGKVFLAKQLFSLSFFLPFLRHEKNNISKSICTIIILFVLPLFFFDNFYKSAYIDSFVGVLAGVGFATVLLEKQKDFLYHLYISLLCFCLVLAKDVGLIFAIFIAFSYMIDTLLKIEWKADERIQKISSTCLSILPLFLTLLAKTTWKIELSSSNTNIIFRGLPDIGYYTKMFFLKNDTTYHQTVVENFKSAFFEKRIDIDSLGLELSYFHLTLFFFSSIFIIATIINKKEISKKEKISQFCLLIILALLLLFYVYSLGATYVSNFLEYEAVNLASYSRYMNVAYLAVFIVLILYCLQHIGNHSKDWKAHFVSLLVIVLTLSPVVELKNLLNRDYVEASVSIRAQYQNIVNDITTHCEEDSHIFFISQENSGFDYWVTRYSVRPKLIDNSWTWSLGEKPFYSGDIWTRNISPEGLQQLLIQSKYDYVAIYKKNDYFIKTYSSLFENASEIDNNTLFRFNQESLLLERVDK